ncbi:MAG: hypothetical protein DRQ62_01545 [Gammaproteobacteria bacterium]|nr:MAG: hypothetical protein DRQ62_01545 [Gammaproteobacteria bacterium]
MTVRTDIDINGLTNQVLQESIGGYTDEAYTNAKKLSGTGLVGTNSDINTSTETYIGQVRWDKPLNPEINIASLTDDTDGTMTTTSQDFLKYVKTVRTHGAQKLNMESVVTQRDGLAKVGRDFGETRAQDEHDSLLAVLKGVAFAETLNGAAKGSGVTGKGGQTYDNDPADMAYGFYVDLGATQKLVNPAGYEADNTTLNAAYSGAQRAEGLLNALGMAYKDYEPDFVYCVTSPEVMASFRSANLVDQDGITEGNINFNTMFNGKFRLIQTRANQGMSTAELAAINSGTSTAVGIDLAGTKTTFLVLPGSIAMASLAVDVPVEIDRNARSFQGGGTSQIWYRWGNVYMPAGYDWAGSELEFPSDAKYKQVSEDGTLVNVADPLVVGDGSTVTTGVWQRKTSSALSLGILPVFHG